MEIFFAHASVFVSLYVYVKVLGILVSWYVQKSMRHKVGIQFGPDSNPAYVKETATEITLNILPPDEKSDGKEIVSFVAGARLFGNAIVFLSIFFFAIVYTLNAHGIDPGQKNIGDALYLDFYFYLLFSYAAYRFIFYIPVNIVAYFHLIRRMRNMKPYKLMILRVFGSQKHTKFLFNSFSIAWSAFGQSITIMDPVLISRQFQLRNLIRPGSLLSKSIYFPIIFASPLLLFTISMKPIGSDAIYPGSLFIATIIILFAPLIYIILFLKRKFKISSKNIVKAIEKIIPKRRNSKMEFPPSELYCYDDVWQSAVIETGKHVDIVLMDIRDYSPERAGSSWELDYLAKNFNLDKVLFLTDTEDKTLLLKSIFAILLKECPPGSPNHRNKIELNFLVSPEQSLYGTATGAVRHLYNMASKNPS